MPTKEQTVRAHQIVANWVRILEEEKERLRSIFEEEKPRLDELIELVGEVRTIDICRQTALDNGYDSYKHKANWVDPIIFPW